MLSDHAPAAQDRPGHAPAEAQPPPADWEEALVWLRAERILAGRRAKLALKSAISVRALAALGDGYHPTAAEAHWPDGRLPGADPETAYLALPARDADGVVVGLRLRPLAGPGDLLDLGRPGLLCEPDGWEHHAGPVHVVQNEREALALLTLGLRVACPTGDEAVALVAALLARGLEGEKSPERWALVVGEPGWARAAARALLAAGVFALWSRPPGGHASCQSWLRHHAAEATTEEGLADLGQRLSCMMEDRAAPPDEDIPAEGPPPLAELAWPPEPPAELLLGRRHYRYLTPAARDRGLIDPAEELAAREALCAADAGDEEGVRRAVAAGQVATRIVEAEAAAVTRYCDAMEARRGDPDAPPGPAAAAVPRGRVDQLCNFTMLDKALVPLSASQVATDLYLATGGWPRRVEGVLFAREGDAAVWLDDPPALFAWAGRQFAGRGNTVLAEHKVHWAHRPDMVTKGEFFCHLRQTVPSYEAVEPFPHQPPLAGHYYLHPAPAGGDGLALSSLLHRFKPATDLDRQLMKAALMTLVWGGPPGQRPAFLVTSDEERTRDEHKGRGSGKTTFARMAARLFGGYVDVRPTHEAADIMKRLLSPEARGKRIALIDNIKSHRFSWDDLEALITAPVLSGHRMYEGEGRRPNTLTWFLTLNGASLSKDMAQRVVTIMVRRPTYDESWEERTAALIEGRRWAIIGDLVAALRADPAPLKRYTRWGLWGREVLARLKDPVGCQELIASRRADVDDDQSEADLVREFIIDQLRRRGHDPDRAAVFVPTQTAAAWLNEATGERRPTNRASSHLRGLPIPELSKCDRGQSRGWVWRGRDGDPEARAVPLAVLPAGVSYGPEADRMARELWEGVE